MFQQTGTDKGEARIHLLELFSTGITNNTFRQSLLPFYPLISSLNQTRRIDRIYRDTSIETEAPFPVFLAVVNSLFRLQLETRNFVWT